jgi:lysozyme
MDETYLSAIRKFEGFATRGSWDYKQVSNGYGTRAKFEGEVIDAQEADQRFRGEIVEAKRAVAKFAPQIDEGSAAALTSLTFNAGSSWMRSGLGAAVRAGDLDKARAIFQEYTKAGGRELPGLVARRKIEAAWIGQPVGARAIYEPAPVRVAAQQGVVERGEVSSERVRTSSDLGRPIQSSSAPMTTKLRAASETRDLFAEMALILAALSKPATPLFTRPSDRAEA